MQIADRFVKLNSIFLLGWNCILCLIILFPIKLPLFVCRFKFFFSTKKGQVAGWVHNLICIFWSERLSLWCRIRFVPNFSKLNHMGGRQRFFVLQYILFLLFIDAVKIFFFVFYFPSFFLNLKRFVERWKLDVMRCNVNIWTHNIQEYIT